MADDIITSVVAGLLIAAISAIAAGLWHQLKNLRSQIADEETRRSEHEQLMADMRRGCEHEKLVDEALRTLLLCKLGKWSSSTTEWRTRTSNHAPNASTTAITASAATATAPRSTTISRMRPLRPGWEESHHEHHHQRRQARHGHIDHPG